MAMDWAGMAWVRINGVDTAGGINHLCDFLWVLSVIVASFYLMGGKMERWIDD